MRYGDSFFKKHFKKIIVFVLLALIGVLAYDVWNYQQKTFDTTEFIKYEVLGYDGKGFVEASINGDSALLEKRSYFKEHEPILLKFLSELGKKKTETCLNYLSVNALENENLSNGDDVVLEVYVPNGKCGKFVEGQKTIRIEELRPEKNYVIEEIMDYYNVSVVGESGYASLEKSYDFSLFELFERSGTQSNTLSNGDTITISLVNGKDNKHLIRDGIVLEGEESIEYLVQGLDVFEEKIRGQVYLDQFNEDFTHYLMEYYEGYDSVNIDESMYRSYEKASVFRESNYCILKFVGVKEKAADEKEIFKTFRKCGAIDEETGFLKFSDNISSGKDRHYSSVKGIKRSILNEGYKIIE